MVDDRTQGGELGRQIVSRMEEITWNRHGELAMTNARRNHAVLDRGKSLAALRDAQLGEGDSAIIIAAGPSIKRMDPIKQIKESGYKGTIICTDSAIAYCLRNDVVPHLAVTLDPHATRIVRWFGDPELDEARLKADDYFGRQDMDEAFADEMRFNREIIELLDQHGRGIAVALSSSASEAVVKRVSGTGMPIYWWNPMLDDPDKDGSVTRDLYRMNKLPCMNAGGNVGTAAWMIAHAVLGKKHVALTGVDFSYYDGTPFTATQYYYDAVELVGEENLDRIFMRVHNPYIDKWFYTDPAYMWYRDIFMEMAADAECKTYNCTQGGILFGENIEFTPLAEFLAGRG